MLLTPTDSNYITTIWSSLLNCYFHTDSSFYDQKEKEVLTFPPDFLACNFIIHFLLRFWESPVWSPQRRSHLLSESLSDDLPEFRSGMFRSWNHHPSDTNSHLSVWSHNAAWILFHPHAVADTSHNCHSALLFRFLLRHRIWSSTSAMYPDLPG